MEGVLDVAGFAVKAIGRVELDAGLAGFLVQLQLVDLSGAEAGAGAAVNRVALIAAYFRIRNDQHC